MTVTLDARVPKMPWQSETNPTEVGLLLSGGYMREGRDAAQREGLPAVHRRLPAVQIPASLIVKLGEWMKVSADVGMYTGDDYSFGGDDGGRLSTGAALDLKLLVHTGAGAVSLITGDAFYPSIGDSLYLDFNVKYAK